MSGNLLVVDDELDILEGLAEMYEHELEEITIYTANNARKALLLLEKIRFDVVVTDINMPKMNGLALFKEIRRGWPQCRVIFLTGFREFDHLYEINKHKDVEYVLKSETDEVLIQVVKDAFTSIEDMLTAQETAQIEVMNDTQSQYIKAQLARYLTENNQSDVAILEQFAHTYCFDKKNPLFFFFLRMDEGNTKKLWEIDQEIFLLLKEFFPTTLNVYYQSVNDKIGLLLIQARSSAESSSYQQQYTNSIGALSYVQEKLGIAYQISLSFITMDAIQLSDLAKCYIEATLLSYRYLRNQSQSILRKELIEQSSLCEPDIKKMMFELNMTIERKDYERFEQQMDCIFDAILQAPSEASAKAIYQGAMGVFFSYLLKMHTLTDDVPLFVPYVDKVQAIKTLVRRAKRMTIFDKQTSEIVGADESIRKVLNYIEDHIDGDLSLNVLAEVCYLNPSYLSRMFKKSTGEKISDYVSLKRIEIARKLLIYSQLKVNEIGQKVGYQTPHSFTRLFKKIEGISPIEYRDRYGGYEKV